MTAINFAFWLQGYFELAGPGPLTAEQTACIARHLALVFVHDIDPKAGGPEKQAELNKVHSTAVPVNDLVFRC